MSKKKKEWLERYQKEAAKINRLVDEIQFWSSKFKAISLADSLASYAGFTNPSTSFLLAKIQEIQTELVLQIEQSEAIKQEVIQRINAMETERLKDVLFYRYVSGYTWEYLAETMDISYQWAYELHAKALKEFSIFDNT